MKKTTVGLILILTASTIACSVSNRLPSDNKMNKYPMWTVNNWKGVTWGGAWDKWQKEDGGYDAAGVKSDVDDMKYAGVHWVRMTFNPSESYEKTIDPKVDAAVNAGISILMRFTKGTPAKTYGTEEQEAANEAFLKQTVLRYKNRIKYWEISNEPNLAESWDIGKRVGEGSGDPNTPYNQGVHKYVLHLKRCYKAIKSVYPEAVVLMGGLSEWHMETFMDRFTAEEGYLYCDEANVHPYGPTPAAVIDRLNAFKQKMSIWPGAHRNKPIWITEIGFHTQTNWPNNPGRVASEEDKAINLTKVMQLLQSNLSPRRPIFWYCLNEKTNNPGYGLTFKYFADSNLQQKRLPAIEAYKAISDK
ncbi:glycosyl hydrolase [Mucilaginibacter sp. PAMB04274]|uniref:glycosyl hydrolase n=1 Tax=Mucilaginibacter sp. PAMB04274 TaxID=3138568 RepID=UPI0031F60626